MATMLNRGIHPFYSNGESAAVVKAKITKGELGLAKIHCSELARSMLQGLLNIYPTERLDVNQALNHPWLRPAIGGYGMDSRSSLFEICKLEHKTSVAMKMLILMAYVRQKARLQNLLRDQNVKVQREVLTPKAITPPGDTPSLKRTREVPERLRASYAQPIISPERIEKSTHFSSKKRFGVLRDRGSQGEGNVGNFSVKKQDSRQRLRSPIKSKQTIAVLFDESREKAEGVQSQKSSSGTHENTRSIGRELNSREEGSKPQIMVRGISRSNTHGTEATRNSPLKALIHT
jgi:hypothetical protein